MKDSNCEKIFHSQIRIYDYILNAFQTIFSFSKIRNYAEK